MLQGGDVVRVAGELCCSTLFVDEIHCWDALHFVHWWDWFASGAKFCDIRTGHDDILFGLGQVSTEHFQWGVGWVALGVMQDEGLAMRAPWCIEDDESVLAHLSRCCACKERGILKFRSAAAMVQRWESVC